MTPRRHDAAAAWWRAVDALLAVADRALSRLILSRRSRPGGPR